MKLRFVKALVLGAALTAFLPLPCRADSPNIVSQAYVLQRLLLIQASQSQAAPSAADISRRIQIIFQATQFGIAISESALGTLQNGLNKQLRTTPPPRPVVDIQPPPIFIPPIPIFDPPPGSAFRIIGGGGGGYYPPPLP